MDECEICGCLTDIYELEETEGLCYECAGMLNDTDYYEEDE